jgi:rhamnosyltransferase
LTNIDIWKKINGFDNEFFIDKVDTDYCVRANLAGFKVIRDNLFVLNHELGRMRCKKILGRVIYITNHNYMRIYYQIRNSILLKKKTKYGEPLKDIAKIITKVVLFEDNKILKIKSIIKGIINGIKYKA